MATHRSVAKSSLHTSPNAALPPALLPLHTTNIGRLPRNSFAPARVAVLTPNSRHTPASPANAATRAHTSGRETARSTAQVSASSSCAYAVRVAVPNTRRH